MLRLGVAIWFGTLVAHGALAQEVRQVFLQDHEGQRTNIASLEITSDKTYAVAMNDGVFSDHFLSMRPFKCLDGPKKNWCHVPYPYEIARDISADLIDLEYDFLFLWKDRTDYGIDMWNGVYYRIEQTGQGLKGTIHEMDMNLLAAPPDAGQLRPLRPQDIIESDPDGHWLPTLVIE